VKKIAVIGSDGYIAPGDWSIGHDFARAPKNFSDQGALRNVVFTGT
jgi:hypothetical protein